MTVRRTSLALAGLLAAGSLSGCGWLAQTPREEAEVRLQERLDATHQGYLEQRARDPYSSGTAILQQLDRYGDALRTTTDGGVVSLVVPIGVTVYDTPLFGTQQETTLGACLEITVVPGEGGDDRGSVSTEPTTCPQGAVVLADHGRDVDELTTDLDGRSDDVGEPPYDPPVCISGELCTEGGG